MLGVIEVEKEGVGRCCCSLKFFEGCGGDVLVIGVQPGGLCLTVPDVGCVVPCMRISCVCFERLDRVCESVGRVGSRGVGAEVQSLCEVYWACVFALCCAVGGCANYMDDERGW